MKPDRATVLVGVLLLSVCALGQTAQAPRSHYDPAAHAQDGSQKNFVFGRINPQNIDYGEHIEQWRQGLLDSTVRDYGFWVDGFAITMLGLAFLLIYWQHRQNQGVRLETATLLTVYHNELAQARAHGDQLQSQYEHLRRVTEERPEEAILAKPASKRENPATATAGGLTQLLQNSGTQPASDQQLRSEIERLKQQVDQVNGTNGKLRTQITTLTQKLEQEQQKNRKLRGE